MLLTLILLSERLGGAVNWNLKIFYEIFFYIKKTHLVLIKIYALMV